VYRINVLKYLETYFLSMFCHINIIIHLVDMRSVRKKIETLPKTLNSHIEYSYTEWTINNTMIKYWNIFASVRKIDYNCFLINSRFPNVNSYIISKFSVRNTAFCKGVVDCVSEGLHLHILVIGDKLQHLKKLIFKFCSIDNRIIVFINFVLISSSYCLSWYFKIIYKSVYTCLN